MARAKSSLALTDRSERNNLLEELTTQLGRLKGTDDISTQTVTGAHSRRNSADARRGRRPERSNPTQNGGEREASGMDIVGPMVEEHRQAHEWNEAAAVRNTGKECHQENSRSNTVPQRGGDLKKTSGETDWSAKECTAFCTRRGRRRVHRSSAEGHAITHGNHEASVRCGSNRGKTETGGTQSRTMHMSF